MLFCFGGRMRSRVFQQRRRRTESSLLRSDRVFDSVFWILKNQTGSLGQQATWFLLLWICSVQTATISVHSLQGYLTAITKTSVLLFQDKLRVSTAKTWFQWFSPFCRIYLFKDAQSRLAALILHRVTGVLYMHRRQRWWSTAAVHELEAALRLLLDGRRTTKRNDGRRNHQPSDFFFPSSADCLLASSAGPWPTLQSPGHSAVPPHPPPPRPTTHPLPLTYI